MKLAILPVFLFFLASSPASAVITLGLSNQTFGLTGIGGNASGEGQNTVSFGSCAFDGTNTACTVSGLYTGLGEGGAYSFVISYAGNGPFPLNAVSQTPGGNLFAYAANQYYTNSFNFVVTLTQNSGPVLNFYSFANFDFYYNSSATCTGVTVANCNVGQVGLTPNATITGQITGTFDPTPQIRTSSGVISASGYGGFLSIAPSTWIEIYGVNLATVLSQPWAGTDFNGINAPESVGGTTVTVAGLPAYINYVSPGQVNAQVPSGVPLGQQPVVVTTAGGTSVAYSMNTNAAEPGLLATAPFIFQGNQNVVAVFSNALTTYVYPVGLSGLTTAVAKPGDQITLYGIGFGLVTPNIPAGQIVQEDSDLQLDLQITFAGVPAVVSYAGLAPGYVGLYQINLVVPNVGASNTVPVAFSLGGVPNTQTLVMAIQN